MGIENNNNYPKGPEMIYGYEHVFRVCAFEALTAHVPKNKIFFFIKERV